MVNTSKVIDAMIEYYSGDPRRIQHFIKEYGFAKTIGELENLSEDLQDILEVTAIVHDIGIKVSEEKYQSSAGTYQQIEGPPVANEMLSKLDFGTELIERVCYLIAHHHTYKDINGLDYQILVEADFLVNISEDQMGEKEILSIRQKIFKTQTGVKFLDQLYL